MVIPREARRITYSTKIRELKKLPLTDYQKAVVAGSLLGDACLEFNWSKTNCRFNVRQSVAQKEYVEWKYEILKDLVLTPPQYYERTRCVWFRTISHPELTRFHQQFYESGKKIVPQTIGQLITNPTTLAVWFMDDGNAVIRNGKLCGYHLNTQSFTKGENQKLTEVFASLHDIYCSVERNHGYHRLGIWQAQSRMRFANLIREHVLPSMNYKLG